MPKPEILKVPPVEAIEHFRAKGFHVGFDWRDTDAAQHLRSFTVAKAMREDILQDIRGGVDGALAEGLSFGQFRQRLEPLLRTKGWWGRQTMLDPVTGKMREVQLGSPRRLRIIYDTNLRTAHARGHWQQIERTAAEAPWLRYVAVLDGRTRPEHMAWHGTVLRFDDPFWSTHYPPNGWRCRCLVQQFSDADLEAFGFTPSQGPPPGSGETRPWTNRRTGRTVQVPVGIDPGFGHNVGRLGAAAPLRAADPRAMPELARADATRERLGPQLGSNPGGTFLGADGVARYVKFYDDPAQAYGEAVANRAYRELGLDAPVSALVRDEGKIVGVASELVENVGTLGSTKRLTKGRAQAVLRGYAADVWLANWDAVGTGLDNVVALAKGRTGVARIDQGGALLFRAQAGRKPREALGKLSEWEGFADPGINRHYARVFDKAGLHGADELGRKALNQIAAINKLGRRTRNFERLVPKVAGVAEADRTAILEALRTRTDLLMREVAPRIRQALRDQAKARDLPAFEGAFVRQMGHDYEGMRRRAVRKTGGAPRHGMNDPELTSVYSYTTEDGRWSYKTLNPALRSRDPADAARMRDYRDTVNAALAKLPDHVGTVRRGTNLPSDVLAAHQPGAIVTYKAPTSTSKGDGWDKRHRFVIYSKRGKVIEQYSAHDIEREVLFPAGTRFRVIERNELGGGLIEFCMVEVD